MNKKPVSAKLLEKNIWPRISAAAKRSNGSKTFVAVAYFGSSGSQLLPLNKGATLVVNMSHAAVASGQTKPSEISLLLKKNVNVYSIENLHAKIYVFGKVAFIGSANASQNSANNLKEAVIETTDSKLISSLRKYVQGNRALLVTPVYAKKMEKIYNPPKFNGGSGIRRKKLSSFPSMHVSQLSTVQFENSESYEHKAGLNHAQKQLKNSQSRIESFKCEGSCSLERGSVVVQVLKEGRNKFVYPQGRVLSVRKYKAGREVRRFIYLEIPKAFKRRSLQKIVARLGYKAKEYLNSDRMIRDDAFFREFLSLWPKPERGS